MNAVDTTHDPALTSWVVSANTTDTEFPIQNLPFGRFRRAGSVEPLRIGVAIGDQVLDLREARERAPWSEEVAELLLPLAQGDLNALMARGKPARVLLRAALSQALRTGSNSQTALTECLVPQTDAVMSTPCSVGDYTDFYTSIHHATAVGKLFRPDQPLMPNYKWVPIGYHGRSSSLRASGHGFVRPLGQTKAADAAAPQFGPSQRLDYELEVGALVGAGNPLGEPIAMAQAEDQWFGLVLLNDWTARDIQPWEYQPLGPFLSKNFTTTLSPWVVTAEALAPFRSAFVRPSGDPQPLPYLDSAANREQGAIDITLEVWLQTAAMREQQQPAVRLMESNFRDAYWTVAQLIAHHTSNGCNLQPGDLLGSGTQSGAAEGQGGSLMELTRGGKQPIALPNGEARTFLQDGDTVILRGHCARAGQRRIGFGDCAATLLPAVSGAAA